MMKIALLLASLVVCCLLVGCQVSDDVIINDSDDSTEQPNQEQIESEIESEFITEEDFVEIGELI